MMPIDDTALALLNIFLLAQGFAPSGGWDAHEITCKLTFAHHCRWTQSAKCSPDVDTDALWELFIQYVRSYNKLPGILEKFEPYSLDTYFPMGTHLYLSIYQ